MFLPLVMKVSSAAFRNHKRMWALGLFYYCALQDTLINPISPRLPGTLAGRRAYRYRYAFSKKKKKKSAKFFVLAMSSIKLVDPEAFVQWIPDPAAGSPPLSSAVGPPIVVPHCN